MNSVIRKLAMPLGHRLPAFRLCPANRIPA
jgi:hypothetical protein